MLITTVNNTVNKVADDTRLLATICDNLKYSNENVEELIEEIFTMNKESKGDENEANNFTTKDDTNETTTMRNVNYKSTKLMGRHDINVNGSTRHPIFTPFQISISKV